MRIIFFILCLNVLYQVKNVSAGEIVTKIDEKILYEFESSLMLLKSERCKNDLNYTFSSLKNNMTWAKSMFDASVKSTIGVEYGNEYQFGNFDQCLEFQKQQEIHPKYCLLKVNLNSSVISTKTRTIYWGLCLPESCSNEEFVDFMRNYTGSENVSTNSKLCQTNNFIHKYNTLDIIVGIIFSSIILTIMISTFLHWRVFKDNSQKMKKDEFYEEIVKSFSLITNIKKLGQKSKDDHGLSCINGIKAISMVCIITGHSLLFLVGGPVENSNFFEKQSQYIRNAFVLNSPLLVDTFLLLSGFLFTRLILDEMDKRRGKINFGIIYIFRYIRLTPAYFAIISLYATWFVHLGDGPLWLQRISLEQERCKASWWRNILYVNNYVGSSDVCMFQSWYLAADTQLFIIAPMFIYPLWKSAKRGLLLTTIAAIISTFIPFYVTFSGGLDPTFMVRPKEVTDISSNDYFVNVYGKTHNRATAYLLGILVGFILYHMQKNEIKIQKKVRIFLWILSGFIGIYSMFSVTFYYSPTYEYSRLEAALYNCLHRIGWNIFISWLIISCVNNPNGSLRKLLSSRALVPLSRLTYCAYLTNGFIELYLSSSIRSPKYLSVISLASEVSSHVILTFFAALILCLMFESPIHGIEKILFRKFAQSSKNNRSNSETDKFNVDSSSRSSTSEA